MPLQMKRVLSFLILLFCAQNVSAQDKSACATSPTWFKSSCLRLHQIWTEGKDELYLPAYTWHNRYVYPTYKIASYNESPWGVGLGKSFYDEKGDWHGLYAFAFLDSHKNIEPIVGYAYLKVANLNENTRAGAGFGILATARSDIFHGIPFPGVLPWVSFNYRKASLSATYIPGSGHSGNVLFFIVKYVL